MGQEAAPLPFSDASLGFSSDRLDKLELTVQGVNFGRILSSLRRRVAPPNEITGHIVGVGGDSPLSAAIRWPGAPSFDTLPDESNRLMTFDGVARDTDLADAIACSLIWAQIVPQANSPVARMRRGQYCDWVRGFLVWVKAFERRAAGVTPGDGEDEAIDGSLDDLRLIVSQNVDFPEVYLLLAELIGLKSSPTTAEQRQAEEARVIYASLGTEATLAEARERAARLGITALVAPVRPTTGESPAIAAARPIILIDGDAPTFFPESRFGEAMRALEEAIARTAQATGFIHIPESGQAYSATAFVVGTDLVAAADFSVDTSSISPSFSGKGGMFFGTDEQVPEAGTGVFRVAAITEGPEGSGLSLLTVPGLADAGIEPLHVSKTIETSEGIPVAVFGYPAIDARSPDFLVERVSEPLHHKRIAHGETLQPEEGKVIHDAHTAGGMAGAPVLDLLSGNVIALHAGGIWEGETKRNFATPISRESVAAVLSQRASR